MEAFAFAVFFDIAGWVASRLSRAIFNIFHHKALIGPMDVRQRA